MAEKKSVTGGPTPSEIPSISLQPAAIQLLNVVPIEIVAKRFPVASIDAKININLGIVEISIDSDSQQAQVILELRVGPSQEPHFFEIFSRVVGIFSYTKEFHLNAVQEFLQQDSLYILLPFMRVFVLCLSMRLLIPPIMLSLIQLSPTPDTPNKDETHESSPENI